MKRRRNSMRLAGWHYGAAGYYFVTICTFGRENLFNDPMFKEIAESVWQRLPSFKSATVVRLDEWVVMPNHVHGILAIVDGYDNGEERPNKAISGTVGALVGAYKAAVSNRINNQRNTTGAKIWQRGYYDRVIRNERELNAIRKYIVENPARWATDRENLDALVTKMTYHSP